MIGVFFVSLTGLCCLLIVALTAAVLGNIGLWAARRQRRAAP